MNLFLAILIGFALHGSGQNTSSPPDAKTK